MTIARHRPNRRRLAAAHRAPARGAALRRAIVGWSVADHMRAELVVDALQMAVRAAVRRPD